MKLRMESPNKRFYYRKLLTKEEVETTKSTQLNKTKKIIDKIHSNQNCLKELSKEDYAILLQHVKDLLDDFQMNRRHFFATYSRLGSYFGGSLYNIGCRHYKEVRKVFG